MPRRGGGSVAAQETPGIGNRGNGPLSHSLVLYLAFRDTAGPGHARPVRGVGLGAMADMAQLYLAGRIAHGAGGVVKQHLLLRRCHQAKQGARLAEVVGIVLAEIPMVG